MDASRSTALDDNNSQVQMLLQKSLQHDPSNWMARYNNALYLQLLGDYDGAKRNWSKLQQTLQSKGCPASLTKYVAHKDKDLPTASTITAPWPLRRSRMAQRTMKLLRYWRV